MKIFRLLCQIVNFRRWNVMPVTSRAFSRSILLTLPFSFPPPGTLEVIQNRRLDPDDNHRLNNRVHDNVYLTKSTFRLFSRQLPPRRFPVTESLIPVRLHPFVSLIPAIPAEFVGCYARLQLPGPGCFNEALLSWIARPVLWCAFVQFECDCRARNRRGRGVAWRRSSQRYKGAREHRWVDTVASCRGGLPGSGLDASVSRWAADSR